MEDNPETNTSRRLVSIDYTGSTLDLGRSSVLALIKRGELESVHLGRRHLVKLSSINRLLERGGR